MPDIEGHVFPPYSHQEWPKWVNGVLCANEEEAKAAEAAVAVEPPAEPVQPPRGRTKA